jgi:hypothetical protein
MQPEGLRQSCAISPSLTGNAVNDFPPRKYWVAGAELPSSWGYTIRQSPGWLALDIGPTTGALYSRLVPICAYLSPGHPVKTHLILKKIVHGVALQAGAHSLV